jgi:hypothetical protein
VRSPKPGKPYISSSFLKTRAIAEYLELVFERSPYSFGVSAIAQTSKTLHFILILENQSDRVLVLVSVRSPKPAKPYISSSFLKTRAIAF